MKTEVPGPKTKQMIHELSKIQVNGSDIRYVALSCEIQFPRIFGILRRELPWNRQNRVDTMYSDSSQKDPDFFSPAIFEEEMGGKKVEKNCMWQETM